MKEHITLFFFLLVMPIALMANQTWDFDTNLEGWTLTKSLSGAPENGVLKLEITGKDPFMTSPTFSDLSAASVTKMVVALKNNTAVSSARIYFATATLGFGGDTFIDFTVEANSAMQEYTIDVANHANWKGQINKIRLDPLNTPTVSSGSVEIDYIKLLGDACMPQTISVIQPKKVKVGDAPFEIEASSSSNLALDYAVVSGPATIVGNTLSLTGQAGQVEVRVSQSGDATYCAAETLVQFYVSDLAKQQGKPNILFVVIEDMGMQLSHLGTKGLQTPALDQCIDEGVFFTKSYCNYPSCSPAKTSFLTGVWPHKHLTVRNVHEAIEPNPQYTQAQIDFMEPIQTAADLPTLIEELKMAGYHTGLANKFHIYPQSKYPFDEWNKTGNGQTARAFVDNTPEGQPFFYMHNIKYTHRPFKSHINLHNRATIDPHTVDVPPFLPDTELARLDWAEYLTTVEIVDQHIHDFLTEMKKSPRYNNTLVVIVSDHGPSYHRGKFSGYNFGYHVPLIFTGPLVQSPQESDALVSLTDLMPTFMDYAGLSLSQPVDGQSLKPAVDGEVSFKGHDFVLGEVQYKWSSTVGLDPESAHDFIIMDGKHRYIRHMNPQLKRIQPGDNVDEVPWQNFAYSSVENERSNFPEPYNLLQTLLLPPYEEFFDDEMDYWNVNDKLNDIAYQEQQAGLSQCLDSIIRVDIEQSSALMPALNNKSLRVVPNPATHQVKVENLSTEDNLFLFDMNGCRLPCLQKNGYVDITALQRGTYFLCVGSTQDVLTFVKN